MITKHIIQAMPHRDQIFYQSFQHPLINASRAALLDHREVECGLNVLHRLFPKKVFLSFQISSLSGKGLCRDKDGTSKVKFDLNLMGEYLSIDFGDDVELRCSLENVNMNRFDQQILTNNKSAVEEFSLTW